MIKVALSMYIVFLLTVEYWCASFRQTGAKVKVCNPKYIKDCYVFTGRRSRRDPYLTNMSATTLMPYGDNVSVALVMQMKSGGDFKINVKCCAALKVKWAREFLAQYTNVDLTTCPFPPMRYYYLNMELPPRNLPIPITNGDYYIRLFLLITATKETIVEVETLLHYDSRGGKKNKNGTRKG